jgi:choline dehydrogenase
MAGIAMNLSECGSEHWLAHPLGARFGLPHGLTVGLVLAESLDGDRAAVPDLMDRIADALGAPPDGRGDGSRLPRAVRDLLAALRFPTLAACGAGEADVAPLAEAALAGWLPTPPAEWTAADAAAAYGAALALGPRR